MKKFVNCLLFFRESSIYLYLFTNTEKLMFLVYITENCIEWWNSEILLSAPESTRTLPSRESIIQEF